MPKLLLVEDDANLVKGITRHLTNQGFAVESVSSGADALQVLTNFTFELIVLDWELGDMSGLEVCQRFRSSGGKTPILFLTGCGDIDHKERGLDAGADDYLVKPFEARELSARLRSLLRRPAVLTTTKLLVRGVTLEIETRTVYDGNSKIKVSPRECALLEFLMRHNNRNFSAKFLRDSVWPLDSEASEETVRTCMRTLRLKLSKIGLSSFIKTDPGSGYIIES